MTPEMLVGPVAALAGAIVIIAALWGEHKRHDLDVQGQRDIAIAGWKAQTEATNRLSEAIEARNAIELRQLSSGPRTPRGGSR